MAVAIVLGRAEGGKGSSVPRGRHPEGPRFASGTRDLPANLDSSGGPSLRLNHGFARDDASVKNGPQTAFRQNVTQDKSAVP